MTASSELVARLKGASGNIHGSDFARALFAEAATAILTLEADKAALVEAAQQAEAWLRECSDWLMTNDLDMTCPMETDPLDIADALAATLEEAP